MLGRNPAREIPRIQGNPTGMEAGPIMLRCGISNLPYIQISVERKNLAGLSVGL